MHMSHLQLVRGRYRVRIVVPPPLRGIIGKESLVQALATSHHAHAMGLAVPVIAAFKARLADAASGADYRPKRGPRQYTRAGFQYHNNVKPRRHFNATDCRGLGSQLPRQRVVRGCVLTDRPNW